MKQPSSTPRHRDPFERVVERHGATVLRVCRAVAGRHDADDAWSETFLSALKAYPDLPADANVEAWLVTIAHRKAIDITRSRARRAVPVPEVREVVTDDPPELEPDLAGALETAMRDLTDRQRQSLAYHHLAGLTYAEVAEIVGGTPAAVRRSAADGMAALRARLVPTESREK